MSKIIAEYTERQRMLVDKVQQGQMSPQELKCHMGDWNPANAPHAIVHLMAGDLYMINPQIYENRMVAEQAASRMHPACQPKVVLVLSEFTDSTD